MYPFLKFLSNWKSYGKKITSLFDFLARLAADTGWATEFQGRATNAVWLGIVLSRGQEMLPQVRSNMKYQVKYQISLFFYIWFPFRLRMERKPQALLTVYLRLESMASFRNYSTICRVSTVQCHINYYLLMAKSLTLRQTGDKCNKTTAVALLHFYYAESSQVQGMTEVNDSSNCSSM